jgi:hypothetical protein
VLSHGLNRYYDPLRLPLDNPPLPGTTGYRQATLSTPAGPRPRRASPVPATPFWPFHVPYAGEFFNTRSRFSGVFHGLRPIHTGSAPSVSRLRGSLHDAADFASRCGPVSRSTPLRPRPLDRNRGLHYRGPWHLPRPDSHRLAAANLAPGYVMTTPSVMAPGLLDALGCRPTPVARLRRSAGAQHLRPAEPSAPG